MATSFAFHTARMHLEQHQRRADQQPTKAPLECTCGASVFREKHTHDRQRLHKRVAPAGGPPSTGSTKDDALTLEKHHVDERNPASRRKRSLWRKILGKAPKCICDKLQRERDARQPTPIPIPSEYHGCVTVRVAGKQVAYTREMQLIKRRSHTPMDAISEDED